MAVNKIIEKIQEDAAGEVETLLSEARMKAQASVARIKLSAEMKATEISQGSTAQADEAARRQILIAELEARKKTLDAQRELVDRAFEDARGELMKLTGEQWEKLMLRMVVEVSETGKESLVVPEKDRCIYEQGFLSQLNSALVADGKVGELTLAEESGDFEGGALLVGTTGDYDISFETVLRDIRSRIEKDVAGILFAAEVR